MSERQRGDLAALELLLNFERPAQSCGAFDEDDPSGCRGAHRPSGQRSCQQNYAASGRPPGQGGATEQNGVSRPGATETGGRPMPRTPAGRPAPTTLDLRTAALGTALSSAAFEQRKGDAAAIPGSGRNKAEPYASGEASNYPQIGAARASLAPRAMSVSRDRPRHMTMFPGGGSLLRAK
jgi:hypothetical protein